MAQMALPRVLELMNQSTNQTAAAVGGDGAIEVKDPMLAVGATEGLGDGAGKRLRAFRAEWRRDPRRPLLAITAQILGAPDVRRTNNARRRVEERRRRRNELRQRDVPHNLTTVARGPSSRDRLPAAPAPPANFSLARAER